MLKNKIGETVYENLTQNANCHVVICKDSNKVYETALLYVKKLRKEVIQEKRDKRKGVWSICLSDGYKFIFCRSEYFENENLEYSCLAFSK